MNINAVDAIGRAVSLAMIGAGIGGMSSGVGHKKWHQLKKEEKRKYIKRTLLGAGIGAGVGAIHGYKHYKNAQASDEAFRKAWNSDSFKDFFRNRYKYSGDAFKAKSAPANEFTPHFSGLKTKAEAKKKYYDLIRKHHPDKGGDTATSQKVNNAWESFKNSPEFDKLAFSIKMLKKNRVPLTEEERNEVMKSKAVWHHGPKGEESPAVWKSKHKDKYVYVTNTHRAMQTAENLRTAIHKYHKFIKGTA